MSFVCGFGDSFNTHDLGAKSRINNLCDDHLCFLGKVFAKLHFMLGLVFWFKLFKFQFMFGAGPIVELLIFKRFKFHFMFGAGPTVVFKLFKFYRKIGHEVKVQVMEDNSTKVKREGESVICLCPIVFVFVIVSLFVLMMENRLNEKVKVWLKGELNNTQI